MTFPSSGTSNHVASVINGLTAAQVTAALLPGAAVPSQMKYGGRTANWIDPGLLNMYNIVHTQAGLTYRM